jgi:serine/threonine protein kinase
MWSLGVVLYAMLSGEFPFHQRREIDGKEYIMSQLIKMVLSPHIQGYFRMTRSVWEDISDEAKDLISHLLVVEPGQRLTAPEARQHPWMQGSRTASPKGRPLSIPDLNDEPRQEKKSGGGCLVM